MSTSRTEIASSVMICKKGHNRCPMPTSKPFVVCSLSTKRYAPSTRGVSSHGSLPPVVPNAGPRRPQPSRFAPSKPFVVCSLSTKRHAPSKRASTITSSSPTQSSPPTVIAPSPDSAEAAAGLDGTPVISSPTNGTCAEASYMTGVLTVVSPEGATTSSMAMLATIIEPVLERRRKWRAVSWLTVVCTLVLLALLAPTIDLGHPIV
ncbi:hypothetical protein L210DRAFT_3642960 [Boletus edulis BED1]|uniref:Uncharacterized protein n=1 Tax=Boletus edulis BED1 TaxID=1328754 RepID=A0AAD4C0Q5_BOLED|nr:hypothetical protein L210DRAFT_3642960 [Boletus edulis BED1]